MEFKFGGGKENKNPHSKTITIEAKNIDFAIKKFICSVENFEPYVQENIYTGEDFYYNGHYNYVVDKRLRLQASIPVFSEDKLIKTIPVAELMGMTFEKSNGMDLIPADMPLPTLYSEYSDVRDTLQEKMIELDNKKKELEQQVENLNKFLKGKLNVIKAMETYLGDDEDIVQIRSGKTSDEVLHIYQQKLYMDEEYGILNSVLTDIENVRDFDCDNIEMFDEFFAEHYADFIPEEKGIRAFQVTRYEKEYSNIYDNMMKNQYNRMSYFYIRNGENLYRVWANLYIPHSVFPTQDDVDHIYFEIWGAGHRHEKSEEEINQSSLPWKYISAYLQGLIERTSIFGYTLKDNVNFLLNVIPPQYVVMVKDLERTDLIEDKLHPSFYDFVKQVNDKTKVGDEIVITERLYTPSDKTQLYYFMSAHGVPYNRNYITSPSTNVKYKVEAVFPEGEKPFADAWAHRTYIKILYYETGEVYTWYDYHERKRRTAFYLDDSEFLNLTRTTEEELVFYLKDRRHREDYLSFIPKLKVALYMKRENVQVGNKGKERR